MLGNLDELAGHLTLLDGEGAGRREARTDPAEVRVHPRGKVWQVPDSDVTVSLQKGDESASCLPSLCLHEH